MHAPWSNCWNSFSTTFTTLRCRCSTSRGSGVVAYAACLIGARAVFARPFSAGVYWADVRRDGATATFLLGAMAN